MSSINKTPHYNLSQFGDSPDDKPSWRGDYTADMSKIDSQMYRNATDATTATSTANTAKTTADNALSLAQTNKSDIAEQESYFTALGVTSEPTAQALMSTINGKAENTALTSLQGTVSLLSDTVNGKAGATEVYTKAQADARYTQQGGYSGTAQQLNQLINANTSDISELESWKSEVESWRTADFKPKNIWTKTADGVHGLRVDVSAVVLPATGQVVIMSHSDGANLTTAWPANESVTLGTIPPQYAPPRAFEAFAFLNTVNHIEMILGVDTSGNVYAKNGRTQMGLDQLVGSFNAEITYLSGVGA